MSSGQVGVAVIRGLCVSANYLDGQLVPGDLSADLQLNNVFFVQEGSTTAWFWAQNVVTFNTANSSLSLEDSIWALGQPTDFAVGPSETPASVASAELDSLAGKGRVLSVSNPPGPPAYSFSTPFIGIPGERGIPYGPVSASEPLTIALSDVFDQTGALDFGYRIGDQATVNYDTVTIDIPHTQAMFVDSGSNFTSHDLFGEAATQFVFTGHAGWYDAMYSVMSASTAIYYIDNLGTAQPYTLVQSTSTPLGTAEGDLNLSYSPTTNGTVQISIGAPNAGSYFTDISPPPFSSLEPSNG